VKAQKITLSVPPHKQDVKPRNELARADHLDLHNRSLLVFTKGKRLILGCKENEDNQDGHNIDHFDYRINGRTRSVLVRVSHRICGYSSCVDFFLLSQAPPL